jgi:acyl dehydratase
MQDYIDFRKLNLGDSLPSLTKEPITKVQLVRYAGASGDFNPLHTDDSVAQKAGLKGVIAQGLLIMGFIGQAISRWVRPKELKRFKVRFAGMTYPGDVITVKAEVKEKTETDDGLRIICNTIAEDQNGEVKVSGEFEALQQIK